MTHYANNPGMVRVDFYKPSGKWYMTEAMDMTAHYDELSIFTAVEKSIIENFEHGARWIDQFVIVVVEPYHKNAYPIMLMPKESRFGPRSRNVRAAFE